MSLDYFSCSFLEKECSHLADAVKALALAELIFRLPRTVFGLFEAAHCLRLLTITEVDVAQVKVCAVEILQQLTLPSKHKKVKLTTVPVTLFSRGKTLSVSPQSLSSYLSFYSKIELSVRPPYSAIKTLRRMNSLQRLGSPR